MSLFEEAPDGGETENALLVCVADLLSGVCMTAKIWILWSPISCASEGGAERVSGAPVLCRHALHALLQH